MLYPRESETREVKELSGLWEFKVDKGEGIEQRWFERPLAETMIMPVPASYNDLVQDAAIRDHIGDVWYERNFYVPASWMGKRVVVRVGSATHKAVMWVNGNEAARHKGGYLPFEADISSMIRYGADNRVTITVNNILDWTTIPPGQVIEYDDPMHPKGYKVQEYFHDFYNYSGIHRPVRLYCTPTNYIKDITVTTDIKGNNGEVNFDIEMSGLPARVVVRLLDENKNEVACCDKLNGIMTVNNAHLWEPGNAYLYTLSVESYNNEEDLEDVYRLLVGIRTIEVTERKFLINGKPFYFKGFGKHEDVEVHGKGLDEVMNVKDFNLFKWIGANSFRTSHYPYSEEIMNLADRMGIVVIDECPAVGFHFFSEGKKVFTSEHVSDAILEHHLQVVQELTQRDKNHPCVVMWSVANEAATFEEESLPYFKKVVDEIRKLDSARPVTIVECSEPSESHVAQLFDVICYNRYYSWYADSGHLDVIEHQLDHDMNAWYERFKKPVLLAEYGADSIAGFHSDPAVMFTEEYQCELLEHYHTVLDKLDFIVGEHVWNFADFATKQGTIRALGNRKGVFTRQRQPKAAAHLMRKRWLQKL